jgi:hypothetical protein
MRRIPANDLILAVLLAAGTFPVSAQQTTVLSKPADISADKANNFMENRSGRMNNDHSAPKSLFNNVTPDLPMPQPLNYRMQDPSIQEALNKRKNWTLLTPEEILGIKTPEEILGVSADKNKPKLSLEEKFLQRQYQTGPTNGRVSSLFSKENDNPFSRNREEKNSFYHTTERQPGDRLDPNAAKYFDQLKKAAAQDGFSTSARQEDSPWASAFANPSMPKRSPEQIASMERFRALMDPAPPAQPAPTTIRYSAAPNPYMQPQPKFNPNGRSIDSLENNSSRPTGINPLPTVTGPVPASPKKRPDWQAQLPPWLANKPQSIDQKRANAY